MRHANPPTPHRLPLALLCTLVFATLSCDKESPATGDGRALGHYPPNTEQEAQDGFIRFVDLDDYQGRLETAIATYEGEAGEKVELIGAVHIGDADYYTRLEKLFSGYDSLLYELIKPEDAAPPEPGRKDIGSTGLNPIALLQRGMRDGLALEYQVEAIDYTVDNFVHADLDADTFTTMSAERGQRLSQLYLRAVLQTFADSLTGGSKMQTDPLLQFKLVAAMFSRDRTQRLKYLFAKELANAEQALASFEKGFGDGESVILTERNKKAIEVLREHLADGEKNIGVFYGGAHLADLEQRIFKEIGLRRTEVRWETAWLID